MGAGHQWIFDALPPSGARRGGNPSEHAFKHDLETFVREVIQNANDQAVGAPCVALDVWVLEGDDLDVFREAVSWSTLRPHLEAVASTRAGRRTVEHLEHIDKTGQLVLLRVADSNTVGLTGDESRGDSHFRALCKDTLFSHKQSESAGGSYGLGKSVLWSFSGLSTVLFSSVLAEDPSGHRSPRLIGRAELPSHEVGDRGYTGSGWFGRPVSLKGGAQRAESVWDNAAEALAAAVHLERGTASGTSILILGFRDPTADTEVAAGSLHRKMRQHAARYFWPAMELAGRGLRVDVGDSRVAPIEQAEAKPFVECWRGRTRAVERLEVPGDVVVRPIPIELPRRRDRTKGVTGRVDLIVKLDEDGSTEPGVGQVAMFRGAGMVVRYWDHPALAASLRSFHAVLACGTGRADPPDPTDEEVERFLRAAEPPGHDDWLPTPAVRDAYVRGYAKAIQRLKDQVVAQLRDVLAPSVHQTIQGPERLRRRFPIGREGGDGGAPRAFFFEGLDASFDGSRWHFQGALRPAETAPAWEASIRLNELGEDGRAVGGVRVETINLNEGVAVEIVDGVVEIKAVGKVDRVEFEGRSIARPESVADVAELGLEVTGRLSSEAPT